MPSKMISLPSRSSNTDKDVLASRERRLAMAHNERDTAMLS